MLSRRHVLQALIGRGEEIEQIVRVYHPFPKLIKKKTENYRTKQSRETRAHVSDFRKSEGNPNEIARPKRHIWTIKPPAPTIMPISTVICVA